MATLERFVSKNDVKTGVIDVLKSKFEETDNLIETNKGGNVIEYDDDLKKLYLKNGNDIISQVSLDASGGGLKPQDVISHEEKNLDEGVRLRCVYNSTNIVVNGQTIMEFAGLKIVKKDGSPPENEHDGVVIYDTALKEQTAPSDGTVQIVKNLVNGNIYYFGYFPYSKTGVYNYETIGSITPSVIIPEKPSNVEAVEEPEAVTISANLSGIYEEDLEGVEKFVVQRGHESNGTWVIDEEVVGIVDTSTESLTNPRYKCVFSDLTNGETYTFKYFTRLVRTGEDRESQTSTITATPVDTTVYYKYAKDGDGDYIINGIDVDRVVDDGITDVEIPATKNGKKVSIV